jgi:hypothetical protein
MLLTGSAGVGWVIKLDMTLLVILVASIISL